MASYQVKVDLIFGEKGIVRGAHESDVIQRCCRQFEDKIDVDSRKSRFL